VLVRPDASHPYWRARYVDEGGRTVKTRLDPLVLTTAEARRDWCVRRSKGLARERMDHAASPGVPRIVRKQLDTAVKDYLEAGKNRLRPTTLVIYRLAAGLLVAWAKREGFEHTDEVTATTLPGFRDYLNARRKRPSSSGKARGSRIATREKLAPASINSQLRAVKTMLNDFRIRGLVPLSSDVITDNLKPVPEPREAPEFLTPAQCHALLEAALRHDAETFAVTRDEQAQGVSGGTLRYEAIAPFVALTLLTGMRRAEVIALKWRSVDLTSLDADGKVAGEIRLLASETKTHTARTIRLDVCPTIPKLLAAMKRHAGRGEYVFGGRSPWPATLVESTRRRLLGTVPETPKKANPMKVRKVKPTVCYEAPEFTWHQLRSTCATYQCNAPGLFGDAAHFISAKRLGHSVLISEKHYAGLISVSREAKTLEACMGVEKVMSKVLASVGVGVDSDSADSDSAAAGR